MKRIALMGLLIAGIISVQTKASQTPTKPQEWVRFEPKTSGDIRRMCPEVCSEYNKDDKQWEWAGEWSNIQGPFDSRITECLCRQK